MVITPDHIISVAHPTNEDWNLQFTDVQYDHQGEYKCMIDTTPEPMYKTVILQVIEGTCVKRGTVVIEVSYVNEASQITPLEEVMLAWNEAIGTGNSYY
jgi:hypothetical protein